MNVYSPFADCTLKKIFVSGGEDKFPSPQGVCWKPSASKVCFFGGSNFDEDFPISFDLNLPASTRKSFKSLTSGRMKTRLVRPNSSAACFEDQDSVYIFGGRQWMRSGQHATDDFVVGKFNRQSFFWDTVQQRGYVPSARFGHTLTKCGQFAVAFGGLDFVSSTFQHVNTNLYFLSTTDFSWKTRPSSLPSLAYHSCTYIGQNTFIIIGGCSLDAQGKSMIRHGGIHVITYSGTSHPENFRVASHQSNLHISKHSATQVGDFIYITGGYAANFPSDRVTPSLQIHRIHIPSLLNGQLDIENDVVPVAFEPCYVVKDGLRKLKIFQNKDRSVWELTAVTHRPMPSTPEVVTPDAHVETERLEPQQEMEDHDDDMADLENVEDHSESDMECNNETDENNTEDEDAVDEAFSESESEDESDEDELFCNFEHCKYNDLPHEQQQKLRWVQCKSCFMWNHAGCIGRGEKCVLCNS